jgi:hypothetical protein
MRSRCARVLAAAGIALILSSQVTRGESMHVFGIHNWDWGANIDVMSWKTGWTTESDLASGSPNVAGRYAPMNAEGFTVIQRLDWTWTNTVPPNPADYPTFASQCANNWARNIKAYCRYYLIGNEVDLFGVAPADYANCFQQCRNAIRAVQPEAKVIVGQWTNNANVRSVIRILGPNGYDGLSAHTGSSVPSDLLNMLDEEGAPAGVGVYVTEWGWVADTNPNSQNVMMQFCGEIAGWNATHARQVYAATWYRYPCWDATFSLKCAVIDNPAFENMTTNCTATNSYAAKPIIVSNPRVEVSTANQDLVARWETNLPAKTIAWYWHSSRPNGEFMPLQSALTTSHSILIHNDLWLWANSEYRMVCLSPAWDVGDGSSGPLRVTTGPWTVTAGNVTPVSADIHWQTIFASTSRVEYGLTTSYGSEAVGPSGVTDHAVTLSGLAPGATYRYRVWSEAAGFAPHHSSDRILQTPYPQSPIVQVLPIAVGVTAQVGTNPPGNSFTVRNAGIGTLTYTITPGCSWLVPSITGGTSSGETDIIQYQYDTQGLTAGEYVCTLTISAAGASNSPVYAPVFTLTLTTVKPDFDGDGDVDQDDFGRFQACLSGPGITQNASACAGARLDDDEDVDANDFAVFQLCLSGANVPADPNCM